MAAAAETIDLQLPDVQYIALDFRLPDVLVVPEMLTDEQTRLRAARFIGGVALGTSKNLELLNIQAPIESLHEAIQLASHGDKVARSLVETNVGTDVIERTIKTGHVMKPVPLVITEDGKIVQHRQSMDSVQANSLRYAANHPIMRARTEAETRNAFRIEELNGAGFFDDYCFVVFSRAENLPDAGFFTDTMSCCIQVTSQQEDGLTTESAFVSGIAKAGDAQHDVATVISLGYKLGVDFAGLLPAEIIDKPVLIRKDLMPNGVIDIVKLYDDCAGGTFFGETMERQDYMDFLLKCQQREESFVPKIAVITGELLNEAAAIHSPVEAIDRLHALSEKHMVEKAVLDRTIDARVFGRTAATHIEQARLAGEQGDLMKRDKHVLQAKNTAQSSSCPGKINNIDDLDSDDTSEKTSSDKDCDFNSKECPVCHKKNVKTRVTKTHISGNCGCKVKR